MKIPKDAPGRATGADDTDVGRILEQANGSPAARAEAARSLAELAASLKELRLENEQLRSARDQALQERDLSAE